MNQQANPPSSSIPVDENTMPQEEVLAQNEQDQSQDQSQHPSMEVIKISDLQRMNIDQLTHYARSLGLRNVASVTKSQMVFEIVKIRSHHGSELLIGEGVLEVLPDGFGFLRSPTYNYMPSAEDIYVSPAQIRRFDHLTHQGGDGCFAIGTRDGHHGLIDFVCK